MRIVGFLGAAAILLLGVACGGGGETAAPSGEPGGSITVYSGRAEALVAPIIAQFQRETGIRVDVRYGGSAEMAATIAEEGNATRADVFWSQDPGPLGVLSDRFAPMPENLLERVQPGYKSPEGKWIGITGRARVLAYNPERVQESDLPASIMELTDPKWRDRIGWAPTNGSFQVMVTALRVLHGDDAARRWLEAVKNNGARVYGNNRAIVAAVAAGEVDVGLVNHYYLHAMRRSDPEIKAENHYLNKADDAGSLVMVSGAGILSNTDNLPAAQLFLDYLLSPAAQQFFATETSEYPLIAGVITPPNLTPLAELQGPHIDLADLADLQGTLELLRQAGVVN